MSIQVVRGDSPLFRRISAALAEAIGRGEYPVGGQLPSELTLMRMYGASRFTIREALAELRSRGLVASRRGRGTVVLRTDPREPVFSETYQSIDGFLAGVVQVPLIALEITDIVADAALAAQLGCEEGRQFVLLRGERRLRDQPGKAPIALVRAYVNATYGLIRPHLARLKESIASTAEKFLNVRVQRIVQDLTPTILAADEAAELGAAPGSPAMLVWRWYYLDNDDLLLVARSIYPQERLAFRTELTRGNGQVKNAASLSE
jgi:GntR family transcriptional regulator